MPSGRVEPSRAHSLMLSTGEPLSELPDERLLALFLDSGRDEAEAAFRTVVVRHGPMVLGVCRHVLSQHHDAEDAFQATFIALARKADTIKDRRVLARWLYEVAYRTALRAKMNAHRKRALERQGAEMSVTTFHSDAGWNELRPVLHDELSRLPDKYRTPVVLCYLEGKTNEEAAELLRWPVGTVKGRLSRARELLRSRLLRRGLTLSAAFLVTSFSKNAVFAEVVPSRLIDVTVEAAVRQARQTLPLDLSKAKAARVHALGAQIALIAALLILAGASLVSAVDWSPGLFSFLGKDAAPVQTAPAPSGIAATAGSCHSEPLEP